MKYYIDSSENPSFAPEDSIDGPYLTPEAAQEVARTYAAAKPGTIFWVNSVEMVCKRVYEAEAVIDMRTEVVDVPAE